MLMQVRENLKYIGTVSDDLYFLLPQQQEYNWIIIIACLAMLCLFHLAM